MRKAWVVSLVVAVAGCSLSEGRYVEEFVELDCTYALDCYDEAVLSFLGWDSLEVCMDDLGPEVTAEGEGCLFDRKAAKECLKKLEERTCAGEGEDHVYPSICEKAFTDCQVDDTGESTDTGDTDA